MRFLQLHQHGAKKHTNLYLARLEAVCDVLAYAIAVNLASQLATQQEREEIM
jgi:hypothetical protein